ncbi:MAG: PIN domain-containing protein [Planctomycetes bacterium]|nr:PIN domain-containing protein [Planctomycetota bacterium]
MRIYFDMCCLKRPFDDQAQPRIHLESEAILAVLGAPADRVEFMRGIALDLENEQNPLPQRASKVRQWLEALPTLDTPDELLRARTAELMTLGLKNFDAFHLACAELGSADVFCTCDDRFLAVTTRFAAHLKVRITNPTDLAKEVFL